MGLSILRTTLGCVFTKSMNLGNYHFDGHHGHDSFYGISLWLLLLHL